MDIAHRLCIVGLEEHEVNEIKSSIEFGIGVVAHQALPRTIVSNGKLFIE